jgi:hypothetical protein
VTKIIVEILALLWKVFQVVLWKWLRPLLGRLVLYTLLAVGAAVLLVWIMR